MSSSFSIRLLISFLLLPIFIFPQKERLRFEQLTDRDGLPEVGVSAIFQDHLGFLWFGTTLGLAQYDGYKIKVYKFEAENATVGNQIVDIEEDNDGNIWVAGWSGLRKFDRGTKTCTAYPHTVSKKFPTQNIANIFIDSAGMIWITTFENKLFKLNPSTGKFKYFNTLGVDAEQTTELLGEKWYYVLVNKNLLEDDSRNIWFGSASKGLFCIAKGSDELLEYKHSEKDKNTISNDSIVCLYQDKEGIIWISTLGGGLNSFNKKTQKFTHYKNERDNPNSLMNNYVYHIYEDKSGLLWISTHGGIDLLDRGGGIFTHLNADPEREDQTIFPVYEDDNHNVWLLDYGWLGVVFYDRKLSTFTHYRNIPDDPSSFKGGHELWAYYIDNTNILWIGTWGGGVSKLDFSNQAFSYFINDKKVYDELKVDIGWNVITEDKSGNYVIGTFGKGLHFFNSKGKSFKIIKHDPSNPESIFSDYISACYVDKDGVLWIGSAQPDINKEPVLSRYDESSKNFKHYHIYNPKIKWWYPIWTIYEDKFGTLWLGTQVGLYEFHKESGTFKFYQADSSAATIHNRIDKIIEDKKGRLWYGTDGLGLSEIDRKTKKSNRYLGTESIVSIVEDSSGKLWLASLASGLILFDPETKQTEYISRDHGFQNFVSINLLTDDVGNLWLVTGTALLRYNPITKVFKKFGRADGLDMEEFYIHLHYKSRSGKMFFGGDKGIVTFYPDDIKEDPFPPDVVITKLSLFNRPEEKLEFEKDITELHKIELAYNQNDLHFEYVALHYSYSANNQYRYKLENFDKDWVDAGTQRTATYTNLEPGDYEFRVIASNCDGVWNETGTSLKIIINPPIWATNWAYLLYIILALSLMYYLWRLNVKRLRTKHEFEMSKFEAEKLHEVDELKSRFFANISHEFRTPLTLILGPVKQMIEKLNEGKMKDDLKLVHRNANKLLALVNQLLDISKIESGNMMLQTSPQNIVLLLKALVHSFTSYAERKKITLKFDSSANEIIVYLDKDKIEKIFTNLLSNAFKFTPDGGSIRFDVVQEVRNLKVSVSDTGIGISKEKTSRIFDRFYQVDASHTREQEGTGIGLSLTKELVELHKGKIEVESEEGKGTTFTISIPLGKDHLKPDEIFKEESEAVRVIPETGGEISKTYASKIVLENLEKDSFSLLQIVEDNYDVRNYIKDNLKKEYRIIEAIDGEDGWNKSVEQIPDLIISDVMMPKMDGFKLCEKLKTDERTSHIPVIILTAKAAKTDKLEGYGLGADEYIMKPFEPDELKARIENLIEQRRRLHEQFRKKGILDTEQTKVTSVDKKFLQKLYETIKHNLSDSSFDIESLVKNLGVSRSVLYRKIVSLTGESPGELIRQIRLRKAAELIEQKSGNLSEIALDIGYSNPAHFSEAFKKQFGMTPSQYEAKFAKN